MLETLKEAVIRPHYSHGALQKARDYAAAFTKSRDPNDAELAYAYKQLAYGKKLISINQAMRIGGVKPNGEPALAIANAAAKWVWFVYDAGMQSDPDKEWRHHMSAFVSDYAINPGWNKRDYSRSTKKGDVFRFNREFFPVRPGGALRAKVPIVPANLRPRAQLKNFQILWEADWHRAPVDPLLLKRVTRDLFEVIAEWNLTDVERLVLQSAEFAAD